MTIAIKFENISKQYRLGEVGSGTIADDLHRAWAKLRGKPDPLAKVGAVNNREVRSEKRVASGKQEGSKPGILSRLSERNADYVWALRDIDFEVQQGEIQGIIGRNGAGKSTLLKLLSRVTAPTTGSIKSKGRIASLLEVGTGFHPELTGRENIYLNGAILGMSRQGITKQLDAIVEFSGCAKYIDTPVKRYSSGMTVRLGFAVAAHLDCEILVVDEVLAVGDAEFQKKCISKMQSISAGGGRTVLFVSHNMASIENICTSVVVLNNGKVTYNGGTKEAIGHYLRADERKEYIPLESRTDREGNGRILCRSISISSGNKSLDAIPMGAPLEIQFELSQEPATDTKFVLGIGIDNQMHQRIIHLGSNVTSNQPLTLSGTQGTVRLTVDKLPLVPGRYSMSLCILVDNEVADWIKHEASTFTVCSGDFFGTGRVMAQGSAVVMIEHSFDLKEN